jgi:hypothetical protein
MRTDPRSGRTRRTWVEPDADGQSGADEEDGQVADADSGDVNRDPVDEMVEESFPASDPPSGWAGEDPRDLPRTPG